MRERRWRSSPESDVTLQNDEDEGDVERGDIRHEEQAQRGNLAGGDVADDPERAKDANGPPAPVADGKREQDPERGVRDPPRDQWRADHLAGEIASGWRGS